MKLGIIVDSSSGLTKDEANKRGWGFLPLITILDDKEYRDGEDLTPDTYYKTININITVRTSFTPTILVEELFQEMSKKYEHVLVYTLSKELSTQWKNVTHISKDFSNIHVIDSKGVGNAIVSDLELLESQYNGKNWEDIKKNADINSSLIFGFAIPKTMAWLVKGGRVSGATAALGKLLNIVPVIALTNGKLEKHDKGRKFDKTIANSAKELSEKFPSTKDYQFTVYHANNSEINDLLPSIEEYLGKVKVAYFPPVITNHIGVGAIGLIAHKK